MNAFQGIIWKYNSLPGDAGKYSISKDNYNQQIVLREQLKIEFTIRRFSEPPLSD
jgi:hypothetical protein